ncbi:N(2)-acetyl-L-2,4-diaminobutanoate deacetylase DoeB [Limibaculum sp. FT325]|uniref:N(2)-acetyl-L-2,4-diaminobutanoate deacetylase DoeB n=1 Tax=Thermohalobaculum sediminis TaxID=2939436 RepID=UPI0020C03B80|nr:N(2)-acetyl-L-2,4-diaminobutanoate deacetylase DoeB [Limibaculum sediminis]MCL5776078.1 N(2)-acetyl-L-2,4-diaminobutanoate deacetylase DoeB [Limibaculum sediminis]
MHQPVMGLTPPSPVQPTIDIEAPGARHGHLRLPWSRNDSAWGNLMIPISVVVGGPGPTALITGANHGDEYEGPLAILDLAQALRPEEVTGRVILLPFMNYPAFRAGTRVSPIDGVNMNRCFPGGPDQSITRQIADFVFRALVSRADIVLDYHSGGRTLDFLPFAASHVLGDPDHDARCSAAARAFNAPYTVKMLEIDNVGMMDTAVESLGKTFVTTELRGGGTSTAESVGVARKGLRNVLIHAGILDEPPQVGPSRFLDMPSLDCFTFAREAGLLEMLVDLGQPVRRGQTIARIWPVDRSGAAPEPCMAGLDGVLAARHFPGLVQPGDTVSVVAVEDAEAAAG